MVGVLPARSARCAGSHPKIPLEDLLSSLDLLVAIWLPETAQAQGVLNCEVLGGSYGVASSGCWNLSERSQTSYRINANRILSVKS